MTMFIKDEDGRKQLADSAYRRLLKASPNALVVLDTEGIIMFISERTKYHFDLNDDTAIIGKHFTSMVHSSEITHAKEMIERVKKEGIIENEVFTFYFTSNTPYYAEVNASCIKNETGETEALLFTARDVTKRLRQEKELNLTHFIIDNTVSLIFLFDEAGNIKYSNNTALRFLGYSPEEISKLKIFDLDKTIDRNGWKELIFDLKLEEKEFFETKILTKEGITFPIEVYLNYYEYQGEELFCAFVRNISERKKAEQELFESEKHYKSIIEQSPAGIFLVDLEALKISSANKAFCDMLGYTKQEMIEFPAINLINTTEGGSADKHNNLRPESLFSTGEVTYRKKNGSPITFYINSTPIIYKNKYLLSSVVIDITKLKHMEKALKESEEKFRLVADYTYDWEYWIDEEGKLLYISPSCERTTGYTREEFMRDNSLFTKIIHHDYQNMIHKHSIEESEKMQSYSLNYKLVTKFGETRWINHVCQPVYNSEGEYLGRRASNRDFTERKIAEELLVESESRYRAVVEDQEELICRHDLNGILSFVNEAYCRYFNKKYDDLIGFQALNFLQGRNRDKSIQILEQIKKTGEAESYEVQLFLDNDELRWTLWTIHPIFNNNGAFVEFQSVGRDITEKKFTEEALESEKEHLRVTLRSIGDAVITTDTDGLIILINRAAEDLFMIKQKNISGKPFSSIFTASYYPDQAKVETDIIQEVITTEEVFESVDPVIIQSNDGNETITAISAAPIRDKHHNIYGVVIVLKDITERVKNTEIIINSQKLESIGSLAAGIAHEFNNILTAILGNISLAKTYIKDDNDKIMKRLNEAEKASLRAKDVARQLITFAKGGAPIKSDIPITELLIDLAAFLLNNTKIKYKFVFINEIPPVKGDINQLRQALSNIIINAREASPDDGSITIKAVYLEKKDDEALLPLPQVKIEIQDSGEGIPKEILHKIFDPYFTTKPNGRGLGLTTSYYIITRHGGMLSVNSNPDIGTTATIYLPVK